jgi:transporter family-2 protein
MKLPYLLLTFFFGIVLTVHLSMNGAVGAALNNPRVGNALFWCIGAVTALVIGISGWQQGALDGLKTVNPLMLTAGAMGASLVFGMALLIPQVGPANFFIVLLTGQVITGLVLSQMGWLGPQQSVSMTQLVGAAIMLVGVYLTNKP